MVPYFPDLIQNFDIRFLAWIQTYICNPVLDVFFSLITHLGDKGIFWIAIAVVMLFFKKTRKTGIMMGVALILGLALGNGLMKNLFARVRPYDLEDALRSELLVAKPHDWSFPSGHTLASFEAATVLTIWNKKVGIPALVIAALVAFSRLYLYIHFPSDVLAGLVLGVFFGFCGVWIVNWAEKKITAKKSQN